MLRMRVTRLIIFVFLAGLAGCTHRPTPAPVEPTIALPPENNAAIRTDLVPDPTVTRGQLPNGLRYAIVRRQIPRARVSVNLLVQAGYAHERSTESEYAHFVEHMAFRGSRDFPGDNAIQTLQRLGMGFGAHVNATTGPFETDYRLGDLPLDDPTAFPTGLKILRSMADGVVFEPGSIKRERGVIIGEHRANRGDLSQVWQDQLEFLAPRRALPRSSELGAFFGKSHLYDRSWTSRAWGWNTLSAGKLRAFYDRWYRPERMILTVAGDLPREQAEQLIRETFSTLSGRGTPGRDETLPSSIRGSPILVQKEKSEPAAWLSLGAVQVRTEADTASGRRHALTLRLALKMLDQRLARLGERADAPFNYASTLVSHFVVDAELVVMRANLKPATWARALRALNDELRRACGQGFGPEEFEAATKSHAGEIATTARVSGDRPSAVLARALAFAISRDLVITSAADDRRFEESALRVITAEECRLALSRAFPPDRLSVALSGSFENEAPSRSAVTQVLKETGGSKLAAYQAPSATKVFPYTDFGRVGAVVERRRHPALDADLIQFANGVRLTLKQTPFARERVQMSIRFGGGTLASAASPPGLDSHLSAWILGGLQAFNVEEERAAFAGVRETLSLHGNARFFRWIADGDASDLLLRLQRRAAYFQHPAFSPDVFPRAQEFARQMLAPEVSTASGVAQAAIARRMSDGLVRSASLADVNQRTLEEFKAWFIPQLAGPVQITLVGDFDSKTAIDAVARTFGALPVKSGEAQGVKRAAGFPPTPFSEVVTFTGKKASAAVALVWPVPEIAGLSEGLRGSVLAEILADRVRLKIRSEMGQTYSPATEFVRVDAFVPPISYVACLIDTSLRNRARVATATRLVAETLAREGATQEEFERARRPMIRRSETALRSNRWWLDVLNEVHENPTDAAGELRSSSDLEAMTLNQINALARAVFAKERLSQVIVVPK